MILRTLLPQGQQRRNGRDARNALAYYIFLLKLIIEMLFCRAGHNNIIAVTVSPPIPSVYNTIYGRTAITVTLNCTSYRRCPYILFYYGACENIIYERRSSCSWVESPCDVYYTTVYYTFSE